MSQSSNPTVCAVMLVNGRPEMVQRAIRCFREQTYQHKDLFVLDSSAEPVGAKSLGLQQVEYATMRGSKLSIGNLRNRANGFPCTDILSHWDSDDWSHPRRIEEQVALLQASGKPCVGYRDMIFWNETQGQFCGAWLYSNNDPRYCLGTSLCYWRSAWEARPFPDAPKLGGSGEDKLWLEEIDSMGVCSSAGAQQNVGGTWWQVQIKDQEQPRMIASIHGGNTSTQYADLGRVESNNWRRAPEWDAHCRERMKL